MTSRPWVPGPQPGSQPANRAHDLSNGRLIAPTGQPLQGAATATLPDRHSPVGSRSNLRGGQVPEYTGLS